MHFAFSARSNDNSKVRAGAHQPPDHRRCSTSLARTSRNKRGERGCWRMRRVEAANPSLMVGALSLAPEFLQMPAPETLSNSRISDPRG